MKTICSSYEPLNIIQLIRYQYTHSIFKNKFDKSLDMFDKSLTFIAYAAPSSSGGL